MVRTARSDGLPPPSRRGIGTGRHYPEPPHLTEAYADLGHRPGSFPVAEELARDLPLAPDLPGDDAGQVDGMRRGIRSTSAIPDAPVNDAPFRLIADVEFGDGVVVYSFTNLYGCRIGDGTRIGPFVEIQDGAVVGARCKIQSHTFVCRGVEIGDEVFVGHGVMFNNDRRPRATTDDGGLKADDDWDARADAVERGASIGSGAVILGGVTIGAGALVGAGAVVTTTSHRARRSRATLPAPSHSAHR